MSDTASTGTAHAEDLRAAFPAVIGALVCVHASMAATRVTASLLVLHLGYPEWTVGLLLSLFAVARELRTTRAGALFRVHGAPEEKKLDALPGERSKEWERTCGPTEKKVAARWAET